MTLLASIDLDALGNDTALASSLTNFLTYSSHRILEQALPHFFDGLLPSQRKLFFSLQDLKAFPGKKYQKSTAVVSGSTGAYHPIGGSYDVLVNMSQDWRVQALLTDPEGNWGPIDGQRAAADRYTEVRISAFGEAVLFPDMPAVRQASDQTPHGIVPQSITYTDLLLEEDYFPAKLPMLLINGSNGIAVGIAQTWQPLAIRPLLTELRRFLSKGQIQFENIRLGYPTQPAITSPQADFIEAIKTGRGSVRSTGQYVLEKNRNGDVKAVVFTSTPHNVTLNSVGDDFNTWDSTAGTVVGGKTVPECPFSRFDNETEKSGIRLVFPLRKPMSEAELAPHLAELIRRANLSSSHTINMTALKDRFPVVYGLEEFFADWLLERSNIIQRAAAKRVAELQRQWHRLDVLLWVRANLDLVTETLKTAENADAIKAALAFQWFAHFGAAHEIITDEDLDILMDINLRQVSRLNEDELLKRVERVKAELATQQNLVADSDSRDAAIDADLADILKNLDKYGVGNYSCPFSTELAELLDTAPVKANKAAAPAASGSTAAANEKWWLTSVGKGADTDIIVYTEKSAILRVSSRSVKSTDFAPNLIDPEDKIVGAFFSSAPMLTIILDNNRLVQVPKDVLPVNTPVYPARIAQLVKSKASFTKAVPVSAPTDIPRDLLIIGVNGTARRTPLDTIASLRNSTDFPEDIRHAAFIADSVAGTDEATGIGFSLNPAKIASGSLKRTGKLPTLKSFGSIQRVENNLTIQVSADRKAISKAA